MTGESRGFRLRASAFGLCIVASCAGVPHACGAELAVLAGQSDGGGEQTYAWQMEYRQPLLDYFDASFSYLNEGHLFHHQRDGGAVQLWVVTPRWRDRLDFALGAGPYVYFDTQFIPPRPWYRNYHGIAEIYTGSLTYHASENWFARLNLIDVHAPGNLDTRLVLLGAGYRLDGLFEHSGAAGVPGGSGGADIEHPINQLGVFAGQTSENNYYTTYVRGLPLTFGIEYRRTVTSHVELSGAWLSENDGLDGRHNGLLGEIWLVNRFGRRFSVGIGTGPYFAVQPYRGYDGTQAARVAGVVSMTAGWQLTRSLIARITWHRSFTHDDQDRDIITAGLAWSWGR